jgi:hypothetical protein
MSVGPRFFDTTGISVLAGRAFGPEHTRNPVVVISASLARRLFGGADMAVGQSVSQGRDERRVIGVVEDMPRVSLRDLGLWTVYNLRGQLPPTEPNLRFLLRTEGDAARMIPTIQRGVREFSGYFEITEIRTLREITERSMATERMAASLVTSLGLLAMFLVSIGIYGVVSYTVAQRTKEIGVRMALGAHAGNVVAMVMREVLWVVALGLAFGVVAAFAASQLIASLLFGVTATDPVAVATASLALIAAAAAASCLPARRAARGIDPIVALRE